MNHALAVDHLAVDHLADWGLLEWWLHYLGAIAVPVLAITLVAAAYRTCRAILRLHLANLVEVALGVAVIACAFAVVTLALHWHIELLYGTLRQISSATRAVVAGLVVALLVAAATVILAVTLGTTRRRWLVVIALVGAVPAVFSLVNDGLYRAATSAVPDTAAVGMPSSPRGAAPSRPSLQSPVPLAVLPRSPPGDPPGPA